MGAEPMLVMVCLAVAQLSRAEDGGKMQSETRWAYATAALLAGTILVATPVQARKRRLQ
jgi:hypothetical protein